MGYEIILPYENLGGPSSIAGMLQLKKCQKLSNAILKGSYMVGRYWVIVPINLSVSNSHVCWLLVEVSRYPNVNGLRKF